jgi:hypothetical protein
VPEENPYMEMPFEAKVPLFKDPYGKCRSKAFTMPPNKGFGMYDHQRVFPVEKLGETNQCEFCCRIDSTWLLASFLIQGKLLPEEKIFSYQGGTRALETKNE